MHSAIWGNLTWIHHGTKFVLHLLCLFDVVRCYTCLATCWVAYTLLGVYFELLGRQIDVRAWTAGLRINELEVLAEDLFGQTIDINCLSHRLIYPAHCLLHLLVLQDQILLNFIHVVAIVFNRVKFVIRRGQLNLVEDLQDLFVLIFHVD